MSFSSFIVGFELIDCTSCCLQCRRLRSQFASRKDALPKCVSVCVCDAPPFGARTFLNAIGLFENVNHCKKMECDHVCF